MRKNRIMEIIEDYGDKFDPALDINISEAMFIIECCQTKMEIVEHSYLYGHMRGRYDNGLTKQVPLYNIKQMTDEEWNRLVARNKTERQASI